MRMIGPERSPDLQAPMAAIGFSLNLPERVGLSRLLVCRHLSDSDVGFQVDWLRMLLRLILIALWRLLAVQSAIKSAS